MNRLNIDSNLLDEDFIDKLSKINNGTQPVTKKIEPEQYLKVFSASGGGNCFFHSFYRSVQSQLYNKKIDNNVDKSNLDGINLLKENVNKNLGEIFKNFKQVMRNKLNDDNYDIFINELNEDRQRRIFEERGKFFERDTWADHYTAFILGIHFGIRIYLVSRILKENPDYINGFRRDILNTKSNNIESKSLFEGVDINSFYIYYYGQAFDELPEVFIYYNGKDHFDPIYRIDNPKSRQLTVKKNVAASGSRPADGSIVNREVNKKVTIKNKNPNSRALTIKNNKNKNPSSRALTIKNNNSKVTFANINTNSNNDKTNPNKGRKVKFANELGGKLENIVPSVGSENIPEYGSMIYFLPIFIVTVGIIATSG